MQQDYMNKARTHLITSSARASSMGGILRPSAVTQRVCARGRAGGAGECSLVKRYRNGFMLTVTAAVVSLGPSA